MVAVQSTGRDASESAHVETELHVPLTCAACAPKLPACLPTGMGKPLGLPGRRIFAGKHVSTRGSISLELRDDRYAASPAAAASSPVPRQTSDLVNTDSTRSAAGHRPTNQPVARGTRPYYPSPSVEGEMHTWCNVSHFGWRPPTEKGRLLGNCPAENHTWRNQAPNARPLRGKKEI